MKGQETVKVAGRTESKEDKEGCVKVVVYGVKKAEGDRCRVSCETDFFSFDSN
jgi:hypothetical protein